MIKTGNIELHKSITEDVPNHYINERINGYLSNISLKKGEDGYCYVKIVRNHLEIGRAKILQEEESTLFLFQPDNYTEI